MTNLALAALFLPLSHFLLSSSQLRPVLVGWLGEGNFSRFYSLLTLVAFGWLGIAYFKAPDVALWRAPTLLRVALLPADALACILIVAGLTTPNPVIVRSERLFGQPAIVRGILRVSRNPFFWGAGLLSIVHVVALGTAAALFAFGSVAFLGIAGSFVLDAKKARAHGEAWHAFAGATSNVPFLAITRGRQKLKLRELGWWRMALGLGLFAVTPALLRMVQHGGGVQ
jgi:uncharacterized membrane protein